MEEVVLQPSTISATDLATLLVEEMIDHPHIHARHLEMDKDISIRFKDKTWLYQVATVLMAIMSTEQQKKEFESVKNELEKLIFPPSPTPDALHLVSRIRDAMKDLQSLLFPTNPRAQMSWARAWLLGINIDESNPATLSLFSMQCMDFYICVKECLDTFRIEV